MTTIDLAAIAARLHDEAAGGCCPFAFCLLGNCRIFDADAAAAGVKYSFECCPVWRAAKESRDAK